MWEWKNNNNNEEKPVYHNFIMMKFILVPFFNGFWQENVCNPAKTVCASKIFSIKFHFKNTKKNVSPFFTKSFIYNFPVVQKNVQKSYVCVLRHDIMIIDAAHSDIRAYFMRSRWKNNWLLIAVQSKIIIIRTKETRFFFNFYMGNMKLFPCFVSTTRQEENIPLNVNVNKLKEYLS